MSIKPTAIYPCFPPISRGQPSVLKYDKKRTSIIYALDKTVVIKSATDPKQVQIYTDHQYPVTAVAMAPSGCYMATGDSAGMLRIWACDTPEQILKGEYAMLGGGIYDLEWSDDSTRIVLVGEGQPPAKVIMWDSGNSVGDVSGHQKKINTCSYKPTRPFRVITGSDDLKVNFYEGPPFKFKGTAKTHDRFVNVCKYSPDGGLFFSAASDMMLATFDAKESSLVQEKKVHAGSIMGACWKADSTKILTASADKSCKIVDAATLNEDVTFAFGKTTDDQQLGCAWLEGAIVSYSLGGSMSFLDPNSPGAPVGVEVGHNKPVQTLCYAAGTLFSGAFADASGSVRGVTCCWDLASGRAKLVGGTPPPARVMSIGALADGLAFLCQNDTVYFAASAAAPEYGDSVALESAPLGMSCAGSTVAVISSGALTIIKGKSPKIVKLDYEGTCTAVAPNEGSIAVGSAGEPATIYVLDADGKEKMKLARHKNSISCLAFSPDCAKLASGCANKEIVIWDAVAGTTLVTGLQGFHTARVSCLAWSPGGTLASGGISAEINVWDLEKKSPKQKIKNAHVSGGVNALVFADDTTVLSCGSDACIKAWAA